MYITVCFVETEKPKTIVFRQTSSSRGLSLRGAGLLGWAGRGPGAHHHPRQGHVHRHQLQGDQRQHLLGCLPCVPINSNQSLIEGRSLRYPRLRLRDLQHADHPLLREPLQPAAAVQDGEVLRGDLRRPPAQGDTA